MTRVYKDIKVTYTCEACGHQWSDYLRGSFTCPKCKEHYNTTWIGRGPNLEIAKEFNRRVDEEKREKRLNRELWKMHASEGGFD